MDRREDLRRKMLEMTEEGEHEKNGELSNLQAEYVMNQPLPYEEDPEWTKRTPQFYQWSCEMEQKKELGGGVAFHPFYKESNTMRINKPSRLWCVAEINWVFYP